MNKTSLIGHVVELHEGILHSTHPADTIVKEFLRKRHYLGSKDRRFISETIYDLLRHFRLLSVYVEETFKAMGKPSSNASIATYAAWAVKLRSEPIDSVLPQVSGLWRVYVPTIECSSFLTSMMDVDLPSSVEEDMAQRIAVMHSFPDSIVREWVGRFGADETEKLCAGLNQPAPITIRVNTLKVTVEECQRELEREGVPTRRAVLSPVGLIFEKRINTQALSVFSEGYFEMQDEGSQLLSMLLDPVPATTVVDACAGGGGKSLHLAALMQNRGTLVAIDVEERRLANMRQRLQRAGVSIAQLYLAG